LSIIQKKTRECKPFWIDLAISFFFLRMSSNKKNSNDTALERVSTSISLYEQVKC
jgi:hypothetical protein